MDGRRRILVCALSAFWLLAGTACIGTAERDPDPPLEADTAEPTWPASAPAAAPAASPGVAGG